MLVGKKKWVASLQYIEFQVIHTKKKETQVIRLDKIAIFFWVSNAILFESALDIKCGYLSHQIFELEFTTSPFH